MFTSVIASRNAKTQFGHHLVAQTFSKLIGECLFVGTGSQFFTHLKSAIGSHDGHNKVGLFHAEKVEGDIVKGTMPCINVTYFF
jgi:hypothetical protein